MKLSLKFRDDTNQTPLLRAKIPVNVLGLPFTSAVAAGDSSDLSFSLRTNFSSGPSLSVSYRPAPSSKPNPNPNPNPNPTSGVNPFSVSLKSGVGIFGSPQNSPLVFTAHFHLDNTSSAFVPRFSLLVKPQFGNFSLRKSTSSNSTTTPANLADRTGLDANLTNRSVTDSDAGSAFCFDRPLQWKDLKRGDSYAEINGMLSGILVTAKTSLPVTKCSVVNFRWGVNFPSDGAKMPVSRPVLVLNKIELQRIEEVKKEEVVKNKKKKNPDSTKPNDLDLLIGVCGLMGREMEDLQRQNREIRQALLEGTKTQLPISRVRTEDKKGSSVMPSEKSTDFTRWRSKKTGAGDEDGDGQKDWNKTGNRMSELESELQKALKATASAS